MGTLGFEPRSAGFSQKARASGLEPAILPERTHSGHMIYLNSLYHVPLSRTRTQDALKKIMFI